MEILAGPIGYLLPKSDLWRTILLRLAYKLIPKLLERATLPPIKSTTILLDNVLVLDRNLNPKIIHSQNVGNGIGLVATQIVNGVADAKVAQFLGGVGYYAMRIFLLASRSLTPSPWTPRQSVQTLPEM